MRTGWETIYRALGLTVGCLVHGLTDAERIAAYGADITYGTNKEFAFDFLRDQIRLHGAKMRQTGGAFERMGVGAGRVQRTHNFAIVDEVDSILIDESRVPLIISNREEGESPYAPAYRAARELGSGAARGARLHRGRDEAPRRDERERHRACPEGSRRRHAAPATVRAPGRAGLARRAAVPAGPRVPGD